MRPKTGQLPAPDCGASTMPGGDCNRTYPKKSRVAKCWGSLGFGVKAMRLGLSDSA